MKCLKSQKAERRIEFSGVVSGDCECFCFEVDRDTFMRIAGHNPDRDDRGSKRGTYRLYPGAIVGYDVFRSGSLLKLKISIQGEKT